MLSGQPGRRSMRVSRVPACSSQGAAVWSLTGRLENTRTGCGGARAAARVPALLLQGRRCSCCKGAGAAAARAPAPAPPSAPHLGPREPAAPHAHAARLHHRHKALIRGQRHAVGKPQALRQHLGGTGGGVVRQQAPAGGAAPLCQQVAPHRIKPACTEAWVGWPGDALHAQQLGGRPTRHLQPPPRRTRGAAPRR